jgi:hypothetical protein
LFIWTTAIAFSGSATAYCNNGNQNEENELDFVNGFHKILS